MGMRANAQTGPLNCLGMGGTWAHVGNVYRKANWTAKAQAGMCTRVAHGVSVTLFLPDWCDQTDRTEACMGRWQLLIAWAWETVGMEKSLDVTDGSVGRAWDCCAYSSVSSVRAVDCSSVTIAWDDSCVSSASDDCALVCARRLLHCVALRSSVSSASTDGAVAPALDDCALVCALRIGRLRACIGRLRARLRSAPSALNCDCCLRSSSMQLCLYMLSVRY